MYLVSVPFPGILFLNDIECNCEDREDAVSVPFPGILFLNLTDVDGQLGVISFPSPSRGSYFSIRDGDEQTADFISVSVPFPGILFLNPLHA